LPIKEEVREDVYMQAGLPEFELELVVVVEMISG
jgi:hypothetical protein